MGQPHPPQGNQSPHTERPLKVYAEQYLTGQPLPVGTVTDIALPAFPNGEPRVYAGGRVYVLTPTEWVISNRYTGVAVEVISADEFAERFGPSEDPGV